MVSVETREPLSLPDDILAAFDFLLAGAPVGFAFFDSAHRYIRLNETLARINGMPVEAHLGRPISEVLPVNARIIEPILDPVFETGEPALGRDVSGETPAAPGERRHWLSSY
jgi:PAS domain-containing protein